MSETIITLETERLRLCTWQERHIAPFAAMNADPAVMRHFPALWSEERTRAMVARQQELFAQRGWGHWAVELKDSGEFIGFVGLSEPPATLPCAPCVEIGWRLAARHWHQGYATEGARAVLRLGFEQLGLAEIVSFTAVTNTPSQAVMRRIGLQHEPSRDFDHPAIPADSPLCPHLLFALTREAAARAGLVASVRPGPGPAWV